MWLLSFLLNFDLGMDAPSAGPREGRMSEQSRGGIGALTRREQQIVDLACEGRLNKDIGSALGISESTVKRHLNRVYRKFGGRKRAELIRMYTKPVGASES